MPPKISLPITIPKVMPIAACHKGISGGQVKANKIVVTKAPSLISWFLMLAKSASQAMATINTTRYIGIK